MLPPSKRTIAGSNPAEGTLKPSTMENNMNKKPYSFTYLAQHIPSLCEIHPKKDYLERKETIKCESAKEAIDFLIRWNRTIHKCWVYTPVSFTTNY